MNLSVLIAILFIFILNVDCQQPTRKPTRNPTRKPTRNPTRKPTKNPSRTRKPTRQPTLQPTLQPSSRPTDVPVTKFAETATPIAIPTFKPTITPTSNPSISLAPVTSKPSFRPSRQPTRRPTSNADVSNNFYVNNQCDDEISLPIFGAYYNKDPSPQTTLTQSTITSSINVNGKIELRADLLGTNTDAKGLAYLIHFRNYKGPTVLTLSVVNTPRYHLYNFDTDLSKLILPPTPSSTVVATNVVNVVDITGPQNIVLEYIPGITNNTFAILLDQTPNPVTVAGRLVDPFVPVLNCTAIVTSSPTRAPTTTTRPSSAPVSTFAPTDRTENREFVILPRSGITPFPPSQCPKIGTPFYAVNTDTTVNGIGNNVPIKLFPSPIMTSGIEINTIYSTDRTRVTRAGTGLLIDTAGLGRSAGITFTLMNDSVDYKVSVYRITAPSSIDNNQIIDFTTNSNNFIGSYSVSSSSPLEVNLELNDALGNTPQGRNMLVILADYFQNGKAHPIKVTNVQIQCGITKSFKVQLRDVTAKVVDTVTVTGVGSLALFSSVMTPTSNENILDPLGLTFSYTYNNQYYSDRPECPVDINGLSYFNNDKHYNIYYSNPDCVFTIDGANIDLGDVVFTPL